VDAVKLAGLPDSQRAEAVNAFNERFGEMERVLWCLSKNSRAALLSGESSPVVESLVWTVKSWWGVQGVRSETKVQMAGALAEVVDWSPDLFEPASGPGSGAEEYACECVSELVSCSRSMGVPRREYSLASKVLHWVLPWRVPAYDNIVRRTLGVPTSWDHPLAYRQVVREIFAMARITAQDSTWVGSIEPRSPLRAFDKCAWWLGGGSSGTAAEVRDPWRVVHRLGLEDH
jgi:hypothetical protein